MHGRYPAWPQFAGGVALLAGLPLVLGDTYSLYIGSLVAVYTIAGVGVSILAGCCREVSIGHSAFFAMGAYAYTLLAPMVACGEWLALVAAIALGGLGGLLFGLVTYRLSGPQFTLATLCLAIVAEQLMIDWKSVTGGFGGLTVTTRPRLGSWQMPPQVLYAGAVVVAIGACLAYRNLPRSAWGRAFCALGDDPLALESQGHPRYKVVAAAMALSGCLAALAGWFFAPVAKFVSPDAFTPQLALALLLVSLVGGKRHPYGPLVGAVVITVVPELLRSVPNSKLLVYAVTLMTVVYLLPRGLAELLLPFARDAAPAPPAPPTPAAPGDRDAGTLEIKNLTVRFGGVNALSDVGATFTAGTINYLVGPNGAGKTTLLNVLSANIAGESGTLLLAGRPLSATPPRRASRDRIARTFQQPRLFDSLTPLDNVLVSISPLKWISLPTALFGGRPSPEETRTAAELLSLFGYRGDLNADLGEVAFGSLRSIELARAVALRPVVLLLDEPSSGVDGKEFDELVETLKKIRDLGVTAVVVTHDARLIQETADQVLILEEGKITYAGPLEGSALEDYVYIDTSSR